MRKPRSRSGPLGGWFSLFLPGGRWSGGPITGRERAVPFAIGSHMGTIALMPLALGLSGGGNGLISSSLAITVVGGLATSTFLTLLVVPVGYSLLKSGPRRKGQEGMS